MLGHTPQVRRHTEYPEPRVAGAAPGPHAAADKQSARRGPGGVTGSAVEGTLMARLRAMMPEQLLIAVEFSMRITLISRATRLAPELV
jgi:hypothetical protein